MPKQEMIPPKTQNTRDTEKTGGVGRPPSSETVFRPKYKSGECFIASRRKIASSGLYSSLVTPEVQKVGD